MDFDTTQILFEQGCLGNTYVYKMGKEPSRIYNDESGQHHNCHASKRGKLEEH